MARSKVGNRNTKQRDAILATIREAEGPLTVPEIHDRAQADAENLGRATVYRTIRILLDQGDIASVVLPDGQTRYEASDLGHHHHFRCRACDQVFDLDICPLSIPQGTRLPGGFRVEDHEITLYGLCPACGDEDAPG